MHLKTLEIQGFKSFPERTIIEFHEGITAIIGPNGSGKSNVTDAIRWVLGEQSVKTLRGARMEDIIFTGTQSRRAMSFAEVTITFDNSDQQLPIDYSEIQVTRRLYRSGDSEYLLNKASCRLKDITTLFMDTGLGRDGYSFVGQGRVDDILSHRSEDRRRIFEEASGIVKFKTRKEEAERKLEHTEQNLLRINDMVNELSDRIEPLAAQAATAKRFLVLQEELRGLEIALILDTVDQNQQRLLEAAQEQSLLQQDLTHEQAQLGELRDQHRQSTEQIRALEAEIETHREAFNRQNTRMGELTGQKARNAERADQLRRRLASAGQERSELDRHLAQLDQDLAGRSKKCETLQRQQRHFQQTLQASEAQMQAILTQLSATETAVEQWKLELDQRVEQLYELRSQAGQLRSQSPLAETRRRTLRQELQDLKSDRDRLGFQQEEISDGLAALNRESLQLADRHGQLERNLNQARQAVTDANARLESLRQQVRNAQYRHKTLADLEKSHEGYSETVKRLMREAASQPAFGQGIRGTVGEQIRVTASCELAIEIALGGAIQNIVTDNEATASRLISYLKQNRAGRATFLPIASVRGRQLESSLIDHLQTMPGYVGLASRLVQAAPDLQGIIDSLLGRVVIAEQLEQAVAMARQTHYACRFVTLEGDVVNPGGAMTGGYTKPGASGMLGRSREIEQLQQAVEQLGSQVQVAESGLPALQEQLQQQARLLAGCEQDQLSRTHTRIREESRLAALQTELARLAARQTAVNQEDEQLARHQRDIATRIGRAEADITAQETVIAELRQRVSQREGANRSEQARRDDLREEIAGLRLSMHSIEESLASAAELASRIEQERQQYHQRLIRQQVESIDSEAEIERLTAEDSQLDGLVREARQLSSQAAAEVRRINEQREQLESSQTRFFDRLEAAASRISAIQAEIGKAEARVERFEQAGDEAKNRLWESYEMTAEMAEPWRKPIENRNETVREVNSRKQAVKSLGPVSLAAIDEYQAVQERFDFMRRQRDDIEAARHKLHEVILELTEAMKRQFVEHFQLINANFKDVFSELFGGGIAQISLENPDDILNCGIDIQAQPPGKKLQNLLLLSGGERCLTAIALLFAILKLRPTPFCVLDEVEAALDDANVFRFTEYIRRYAEASQFILVTHRKGTMEAADRLYGVTMQERGISRILSMQLTG